MADIDPEIAAIIAQQRKERSLRRAALKQRRETLEAAGLPTGRSYKDQPAWKQANQEKRATVQRLRDDLHAHWPDVTFHVGDKLTYSPNSYTGQRCAFPVYVSWHFGPQESEIEQFASAYVEAGARQQYRIGYTFNRREF